eukprot:m.93016 g.93016  ORF g.93016 m.93016 type:complete len:130 (+) comp15083_c0_seq1:707-1096(+)
MGGVAIRSVVLLARPTPPLLPSCLSVSLKPPSSPLLLLNLELPPVLPRDPGTAGNRGAMCLADHWSGARQVPWASPRDRDIHNGDAGRAALPVRKIGRSAAGACVEVCVGWGRNDEDDVCLPASGARLW